MILGPVGPFDKENEERFLLNNSAPSTCRKNQKTPMSGSG